MHFVDEHRARRAQLAHIGFDGAQRGAVGAEGDGAVEAVEVGVARAEHLQVVGEAREVVFGERGRRLQHELLIGGDDQHAVAHAVEEAQALGELLHHFGERAGDAQHCRGAVALEAARAALDGEREVGAGGDEVHRIEQPALGDADVAQADVGQRIALVDAAQQELDVGGGFYGQLDLGEIGRVGGGAQTLGRGRQVGVAGDARQRLATGQENLGTDQYHHARPHLPIKAEFIDRRDDRARRIGGRFDCRQNRASYRFFYG